MVKIKGILTVGVILLFLGILLFGAFGYKLLSNCSFLDGLYMTVITITTVGYGEVVPMSPVTRVFTIVLILIGASFVLYVFGRITETVVEGGLRGIYGRINMEKKVVDAVNEQIKNELFSAYLYLSMAAYFESVNLDGFAHWMRIQAKEEWSWIGSSCQGFPDSAQNHLEQASPAWR